MLGGQVNGILGGRLTGYIYFTTLIAAWQAANSRQYRQIRFDLSSIERLALKISCSCRMCGHLRIVHETEIDGPIQLRASNKDAVC